MSDRERGDPGSAGSDACLICGGEFRMDGPLGGRGDEAAATQYRVGNDDPKPHGTRMGRVHIGCMKSRREESKCSRR